MRDELENELRKHNVIVGTVKGMARIHKAISDFRDTDTESHTMLAGINLKIELQTNHEGEIRETLKRVVKIKTHIEKKFKTLTLPEIEKWLEL